MHPGTCSPSIDGVPSTQSAERGGGGGGSASEGALGAMQLGSATAATVSTIRNGALLSRVRISLSIQSSTTVAVRSSRHQNCRNGHLEGIESLPPYEHQLIVNERRVIEIESSRAREFALKLPVHHVRAHCTP